MQKPRLLLVTLSHFCVDSYATLLAPLLPLLRANLELSLAQTGFLGTIVSICNISQPLMGIWADRMARRWLVVGGLALATIFAPLMGIATNYLSLVGILAMGGIGVAAFHPQVFSLAGELSAPHRSFGLALFIFGGTLGLGLAPLWAPTYTNYFGLEALPYVSIPGLLFLLLLLRFIPLDNPNFADGQSNAQWRNLGDQAGPLCLITVIVILRSVTGLGFGVFLALLAQERGLSLVDGGIPLGIYNIAGVVGALAVGYLADRIDPKPLVWGSLLLSVPPLYAFIFANGALVSNVLLFVGGGLLMSSNSIMITLAQELAPENSGLASSLPLGFSWGLASLTLPVIGYFGDQIGVAETLKYLALLPILTAGLAFFLPSRPSAEDAT
ncbi:MAG: MFS transporter [Candidatus Latescibacterota bacterium]|nr:MFS transporter [Candidatus Latescibacterota bacterium]